MGLLYTKTEIFHFKEKIDSLSSDTQTILTPLHIRLKPTNICNHNCWYCAYRRENIQLGKDMIQKDQIPYQKMLDLIEDFVTLGVKAVTLSGGGDPLNYPYLLETLQRLSETNIKFGCLTNGSRLNGELAKIFAQKGSWIRISIDGWDSSSYATYRGVSNEEFNRVISNLENFKKLGGSCYLGIVIIIDRNNASHVYDMIKNFKNIGVDSVKLSPCIISNNSKESNDYHQPYIEMVNQQISRAQADFKDSHFEISNSYHLQLETFQKNYSWCPYIQIRPVIGADLNVYSCQDKAYNLDEGLIYSIKHKRFRDVWLSDKSKFFKINPKLHCRHHCVANEQNNLLLDYLNTDKEHLEFV